VSETLELDLEGAHGDPLHVTFRLGGVPLDDDTAAGGPAFAGRMLRAFHEGRVEVAGMEVDDLWVADFHLLRDLAERFGIVAPDPDPDLVCRNCGLGMDVDPTGRDPESLLAAPPETEPPPERWSRAVGGIGGATFAPVRVRTARGYWRALVAPPARLGPAVVRGLGLRSLRTERRSITEPRALARQLDRASDALLDVVTAAFLLTNYPARLRFPVVCPECGTVHDVPTPSLREGDEMPAALDVLFGGPASHHELPDLAAFTSLVERVHPEVFRERSVAHLVVEVNDEVPPVDDSGEPLMGSYLPTHDPISGEPVFLVALYYRTFVKMFEEAPFDVEAEVRDTLDHEVEHHLHHLEGYDPLDAEERAEARRDLERTFGRDAVARAERRWLAGELGAIARFFVLPLVLLALLLGALVAAGVID